ncbi:3D-(3,5/4)-trihydroxycyclohexane-1,2-dione acylhydrolase (decyclizing), partial [Salmonella enterica subsp. enterica serovar Corvallis]|nr:3D-(3,5/4)-trihydroxycyclohexane-1,2-dione acylhydrolase (decyclizing) [Salmonella enterica subsp. enterica serovar Corvallis]
RLARHAPTEPMLNEAVALIRRHQRPLIVCGGGVKYSQAEEALLRFAERCHLPIAETQAGKGALSSAHPLNVGGIGETGSLAANLLAQEADLIIGVGTRYTDFTTSSKWIFQNPDVRYLNINVSRFDVFKLDGVQMQGDARVALTQLSERLAQEHYASQWGETIHRVRSQYMAEVERVYAVEYSGEGFKPEIEDHMDTQKVFEEFNEITRSWLTQTRVLGVLNRMLPENALVVAAAGSLPGDLQRVWQSRGENDYHVEYGYSCMGYEVNAALGAKLAQPEREVYSFVGD